MKKEDYYARINYRGGTKIYHVVASCTNSKGGTDIRVEYVDYNPNREWSGVWITNGFEKIIKKYGKKTDVYQHFNSILQRFKELYEEEATKIYNKSSDKTLADVFYYNQIGTSKLQQFYKQAVKENGELKKDEHLQGQQNTINQLNELGYFATFAVGFDEAREIIDNYMTHVLK